MMKSTRQARLISFLQEDLAIPAAWIEFAQKQDRQDSSQLPMVLWQYGLITLSQLERVFDWGETV